MINDVCLKLYNKKFDLKTAFIHSSFAHKIGVESNEKLEFLGDSIINYYITLWLFKKNQNEGELSKLRAKMVSTNAFAKITSMLNLVQDLKIIGDVSQKIKANLLEAVVAEIYLQLNKKDDIEKLIKFLIIDNFNIDNFEDSKTLLQELLQKNKQHNIVYVCEKDKSNFVAKVFNNGVLLACGWGLSKQKAEKDAAMKALKNLEKEGKKK